jgi:predicted nucleic acid-binding Zn ribbon protein
VKGVDLMREPNVLSESEMKEIEELLNNKNLRVNWRDGVLEDYYYTKELLSTKERDATKKENKKEKKKKYCSKCGTLINAQTKQCSGCGKQYANKKTVLNYVTIVALLVICLALSVTAIYFHYESYYWLNQYANEKTESDSRYTPLYEDYTSLLSNKKTVGMYNVEVLAYSDNNRYHVVGSNCWERENYSKYHNSHLAKIQAERDGTKIWTAEYANEQGYHPCPICFK